MKDFQGPAESRGVDKSEWLQIRRKIVLHVSGKLIIYSLKFQQRITAVLAAWEKHSKRSYWSNVVTSSKQVGATIGFDSILLS